MRKDQKQLELLEGLARQIKELEQKLADSEARNADLRRAIEENASSIFTNELTAVKPRSLKQREYRAKKRGTVK